MKLMTFLKALALTAFAGVLIWLGAERTPELPGETEVTVTFHSDVEGHTGLSVPFPRGAVQANWGCEVAGKPARHEVLSQWEDGSVRWMRVWADVPAGDFNLTAGKLIRPRAKASGPWSPKWWITADDTLIVMGTKEHERWELGEGVVLDLWMQPEGRARVLVRNMTPTGTVSGGNQPNCASFGMPEERSVNLRLEGQGNVRWAERAGIDNLRVLGESCTLLEDYTLRAGEGVGFWIEPNGKIPWAAVADAEYLSASGVWAKPLVQRSEWPNGWYADHFDLHLAGIANRFGAKEHWRNPREAGEMQRDWDGGNIDVDFQTHNQEYESARAMLLAWAVTADQRALEVGIANAAHWAAVDVYWTEDGPLQWMWGMPWQHTKHGGSGQGNRERSSFPANVAHVNGRGALLAWYIDHDPVALLAFDTVARRLRWKIDNGPGMPGISGLDGEMRGPANALGFCLDRWQQDWDPEWLALGRRVVDEVAATHPWQDPENWQNPEWRTKPWMDALWTNVLLEWCEAVEAAGLDTAQERSVLVRWQRFLVDFCYVAAEDDARGWAHVPYEVGSRHDGADIRDVWNLVAGDAVVDGWPQVGEALFKTGSETPWCPSCPRGEYTKLLQGIVLVQYGHRVLASGGG